MDLPHQGFDYGSERSHPPLLRLHADPELWSKVAAMWHRETARERYLSAGFDSAEARRRANEEAFNVARRHGFRGTVRELKGELRELLGPATPPTRLRDGLRSPRFWEEMIRRDLLALLASPPPVLRDELVERLHDEVRRYGPFEGRLGIYKLAFVIGFVPPLPNLARRNAFIEGLCIVGNDTRCCDVALFAMIFRLSRTYTLESFESRQGVPIPVARAAHHETKHPTRSRLQR
jgi:hypothetical protein